MTSPRKFRVGIIGAGNIVECCHLPVIKNNKSLAVSWLYDVNKHRAEFVSKMFRVPLIQEAQLEASISEIDICLLAVPYGVRKVYLESCSKKGVAVYVEKPFAKTLDEHTYFSSLFQPFRLAIGFQRRYYPWVGCIGSIISSGIFGEVKQVNLNQGFFSLKQGNSFMADVSLSGGGAIIDSAIHAMDQLLVAAKTERVSVKEVKFICKNGIDYDSIFLAELHNGDKKFDLHAQVSSLRNLENGLTIFFEKATVKSNFSCNASLQISATTSQETIFELQQFDLNGVVSSVNDSFVFFWQEFIEGLSTYSINLTHAITSTTTTSLIEQLYKKMT